MHWITGQSIGHCLSVCVGEVHWITGQSIGHCLSMCVGEVHWITANLIPLQKSLYKQF